MDGTTHPTVHAALHVVDQDAAVVKKKRGEVARERERLAERRSEAELRDARWKSATWKFVETQLKRKRDLEPPPPPVRKLCKDLHLPSGSLLPPLYPLQ